ncbi:hypothetical protein PM082_004291 [Marasmius tenuissimus]|nr:hypothetical protein PM082_004291 [Marasmius tenuissimus]
MIEVVTETLGGNFGVQGGQLIAPEIQHVLLGILSVGALGLLYLDEDLIDTSEIIDIAAAFDIRVFPLDMLSCHFISTLALEIASRAQPSLIDSGCIAFSHDEGWMSVLEDLDDPQVPRSIELLKRICEKFKFVDEGDVIYTERMTLDKLAFVRESPGSICNELDLIPVLFSFQIPDVTAEHELQSIPTTQGIPLETHPTPSNAYDPVDLSRRFADDHCHPGDYTVDCGENVLPGQPPVDSSTTYGDSFTEVEFTDPRVELETNPTYLDSTIISSASGSQVGSFAQSISTSPTSISGWSKQGWSSEYSDAQLMEKVDKVKAPYRLSDFIVLLTLATGKFGRVHLGENILGRPRNIC